MRPYDVAARIRPDAGFIRRYDFSEAMSITKR
jgi:hypothetical protein